jgi:hypothetical protein
LVCQAEGVAILAHPWGLKNPVSVKSLRQLDFMETKFAEAMEKHLGFMN